MPDLRAILVALGVGIGVAVYTTVFWHWQLAIGGGAGIVLGGLTLVGSVSIGPDPAEADAAWRAAAPEFVDPPAGPAGAGAEAPAPKPDGGDDGPA